MLTSAHTLRTLIHTYGKIKYVLEKLHRRMLDQVDSWRHERCDKNLRYNTSYIDPMEHK